jgi:hypothetical protein
LLLLLLLLPLLLQIPPRLDGLKVYDDHVGDEQLMLEVAASWGSNSKVSVGICLRVLFLYFIIACTIYL